MSDVKPIPYTRDIPVLELGPEAVITMVNPWMLPVPTEGPLPHADEGDVAAMAARTAEARRRGKRELQRLVPAWRGIYDIDTHEPLPAPGDDPEVYDRVPGIVHVKVRQAVAAMELDMEWDPTKRPAAVAENGNSPKTSESPRSTDETDSGPSTTETTQP